MAKPPCYLVNLSPSEASQRSSPAPARSRRDVKLGKADEGKIPLATKVAHLAMRLEDFVLAESKAIVPESQRKFVHHAAPRLQPAGPSHVPTDD